MFSFDLSDHLWESYLLQEVIGRPGLWSVLRDPEIPHQAFIVTTEGNRRLELFDSDQMTLQLTIKAVVAEMI